MSNFSSTFWRYYFVHFLLQNLLLRSPKLFWFLWCCIWLSFTHFWKTFRIFILGILKFLDGMTWCGPSWINFASYVLNSLNIENRVHQLRKTFLYYLFDNFLFIFSPFFQLFKITIRLPVLILFWKKSLLISLIICSTFWDICAIIF